MQRQADSHNVNDSLLLELFLQQLPSSIHTILASIKPLTPTKTANVGDRIIEISRVQVNSPSSAFAKSSLITSLLLDELKSLRKEITALRRSCSSFRSRNFSRKSSPAPGICWYHRRFKDKATKCTQPCSYTDQLV